jgi:ERCC4-related helicase
MSAKPDSRVVVFTQLWQSANEVWEHISKFACVKSSVFIRKSDTRQNSVLNEHFQHEVVSLFKKGNINYIVSTSVGEEGLDLIVCCETALKNVQRMEST